MKGVFIAIGSNIGDGVENCNDAVKRLRSIVDVKSVSPLYKTKPWGVEAQADFINGVVEVETKLSAMELLDRLKGVECDMARVDSKRWGPRLIDLDIIFYGDEVIDEEDLQVPHSYMHERAFVLVPLNDIAPDLIHPRLGKSVRDILKELNDLEVMERI